MADEDMSAESQDVPGHVEPDPGVESAPESEIPVGADALTDEQIAQAEEAGPADGGGDGDDDGGGGDALDVSALMDDSGDAGDDAGGDDAGDDAPEASADDAGDDAGDADDAGDDADATPDDDTAGPDAAEEEA